jgi:hypothetical protein
MPKLNPVIWGSIAGGVCIVAGGVLLGLHTAKHHRPHHIRERDSGAGGLSYPLNIDFMTDQNTHFNVFACITMKHGDRRARLIIPKFAVTTTTLVKSVKSAPIITPTFPVNLVPISYSPEKMIKLYFEDTKTTATGQGTFKDGVVTLSMLGSDIVGIGKAWGLAQETSFEFEVSN